MIGYNDWVIIYQHLEKSFSQWIGLRENLQEKQTHIS